MKSSQWFIARFYIPLGMSAALLFLALFSSTILEYVKQLPLEIEIPLWIISLKIPPDFFNQNSTTLKIGLCIAAIALFIYAASINFSEYFPSAMKMDAFYDIDGIEKTLQQFDQRDLIDLNLDTAWKDHLDEYDQDVVFHIRKLWERQGLPNAWPEDEHPRPHFTGTGYSTFIVERTAFLKYKITESISRMNYSVTTPRNEVKTFPGVSKLKPSSRSYIRPILLKIARSPKVLISPEFMQIFGMDSLNDDTVTNRYDHTLTAATKITLLPLPSFGDTLFLWRAHSGKMVPVAYSIARY